VFSAPWAGYSYSEPYQYGITPNVAGAYGWDMTDYLPQQPAVDINAVIYQYSVEKIAEDDFLVHIQNKDTEGPGYIFRETDDWSGLPSNTINKYIPLPNISADRFGEGSIETEGSGKVYSQSVMYNYRIDLADITPDYIPDIPEPEIYDALQDDAVISTDADAEYSEEEEGDDSSDKEERRERALRASKKAIGIGNTVAQQMMMQALTRYTLGQYARLELDGGVYTDTALVDAKLPENRQGLRNGLAQQILHTKMVDDQYRR
jgi:hypothetical protein